MTWPKRYGSAERTALERYIGTEEMLAAGAPVRGHWTSDRQSGPIILRYGTDRQKDDHLPASFGRVLFLHRVERA
jgi:alkylation response protein AidB-like acyl-CoA dehydrogenase